MRDYLELFINGKPARIAGEHAFTTLSDYLRLDARPQLTGTKVVCAEGDCGACAVLVGRIVDGKVKYSSVCSCIMLMIQLDGTHVITVEGLKQDGQLNPIQESMVACHGTQCGFCTPGFIVALHGMLECGKKCDEEQVRRGLVGNLCRCTGYDSIVKAALQTDRSKLNSLESTYPAASLLPALTQSRSADAKIIAGARMAYKPATLAEALDYRAKNPTAIIVCGATDVGVLHNKNVRKLDNVLYLGDLAELRQSNVSQDTITIGAASAISELESLTADAIPELSNYLSWFGSPLIKNGGSIAGNLVTGSPIGDSLPPLMALGAEIELTNAAGSRRVPLDVFYTGYRKTVMKPDEIVTGVRIPIPAVDRIFKLYKVSRRKDLDISTFSAAFLVDRAGDQVSDLRIFFGGVGPMVLRMKRTEELLRGKTASLELFEQAAEIAQQEVTPISDVRGSELYRRQVAGNIVLKLWYDAFSDGDQSTASEPKSPAGEWEPAIARDPSEPK